MKKHKKMIGRILLGLPFVIFGIFHLLSSGDMAGFVPSFYPGPGALWVVLAGLVLLVGGLTIVVGRFVYYGATALILLLSIFVLTMHIPTLGSNEMSMVHLLKDIGLIGGLILVKVLYGCSCKGGGKCDCSMGEKLGMHGGACSCEGGVCTCGPGKMEADATAPDAPVTDEG